MHDTDFDALLTRTLTEYAEGGLAPIDAMAMAAAAEAVAGRRRAVSRFVSLPRPWRIAVVVGLTLAALVAVAVIGSQIYRLLQPPAAHRIVITTGSSTECPGPDGGYTFQYRPAAIDVETGTTQALAPECEAQILLSPDGTHTAGVTGKQLIVSDLRSGSSTVLPGASGSDLEAVQWSPKGTYLYWVGDNSAGRPTTTFVSSLADARHTALPTNPEGGYGGVTWSTDESRMLISVSDSSWIGNGDGTGFRQLTSVGSGFLAMSPDGRRFAFPFDPPNAAGTISARQIAVGDGFSPPGNTTSGSPAAVYWAPAWLPDGSALAAISSNAPWLGNAPAVLELLAAGDLRLRARFVLPAIGDASDQPIYGIKPSPDGRFVAVSRRVVTRGVQGDNYHEDFTIVRLSDGAILPRPSQRPAELTEGDGWTKASLAELFFSPDSRRVVYHVPFSFQVVDLDGSGHKHLGFSDVAREGWGNQLVWDATP